MRVDESQHAALVATHDAVLGPACRGVSPLIAWWSCDLGRQHGGHVTLGDSMVVM